MDVAEGLAYLHDKSILHGDMKSGNLLVKVHLLAVFQCIVYRLKEILFNTG